MNERLDRIMAYLDDELASAARRAFEAEMAADPALAAEVEAHRDLGEKLAAAFGPVADEPVPLRLTMTAEAANERSTRRPYLYWTGMAASLIVGLLAGRQLLAPDPGVSVGTDLAARSDLGRALERQLASQRAAVRIGLTFRDRDGHWCRTFQSRSRRLAGLACREDGAWQVRLIARWSPSQAPDYRTASSDTPPEVLAAVDEAAAGVVLDAAQERAARDGGWRP